MTTLDLFHFWPKQWEATRLADLNKYFLYGGTRGPGKSYWMRWYLLRFLLMCQGYGLRGVRVGLFCEDYPTLRDRHIGKIEIEFPRSLGVLKESNAHGLGFHLHNNGGVLALRNLDDPGKYAGAEFAAIGVDQLERNAFNLEDAENMFDVLRGSMRWPGIRNTRFVATANPGGPGHLSVKRLWIDRDFPERLQKLADQFVFLKALPTENPALDESYWEMLSTLPEELRRAWLDGDWEIFSGQVFKEWRRDKHVIAPMNPPAHWMRLRGLDWGRDKPFACVVGAQDPDSGRVIVYKELYEAGLNDRVQAQNVLRVSPEGRITYADPSIWTKKSIEQRSFSTADEYAAAGLMCVKADNDRIGGLRKIHTMLEEVDDDGVPLLQFTENCTNLIRTLPALPRDETNVEDVDSKADDHVYDALRYLLTPINPRPRRKPKPEPTTTLGRIEQKMGMQQTGLKGGDF